MKYVKFVLLFIIVIGFSQAQYGTYRVCTGVGPWTIERFSTPPAGPKPAEIVSDYWVNYWWGSYPYPWSKLNNRDRCRWLSWEECPYDTGFHGNVYRHASPCFKVYAEISRATLWISLDDYIQWSGELGAHLVN